MKSALPKKRYRRYWKAQGAICYLCGKRMKWESKWDEPTLCTVDHIVPKIMGGDKMPGNVALAHLRCNTRKCERPPTACERLFGNILAEICREEIPPQNRLDSRKNPHINPETK